MVGSDEREESRERGRKGGGENEEECLEGVLRPIQYFSRIFYLYERISGKNIIAIVPAKAIISTIVEFVINGITL